MEGITAPWTEGHGEVFTRQQPQDSGPGLRELGELSGHAAAGQDRMYCWRGPVGSAMTG
jgi:hypothetical protein